MIAWEIEAGAFPIARQILPAAIDRAIFKDDAGAADADDGGQLDLVLPAPLDKFLQHFRQALDGAFAVRILIAVTPKL